MAMPQGNEVQPETRYKVVRGGTPKRPFAVKDTRGGWECFRSASEAAAQRRAAELNRKVAEQTATAPRPTESVNRG